MPVPKALSPAHRGDDQLPQATHLADNISAVRLQRLAARLHELGLRSKYELLRELAPGADHLIRLEAYARLDADMLRELGGDVLPIDCLCVIDGYKP